MLKAETLEQTGRREYEEPEGEFLELISTGTNTVTVLTKVDSDKVRGEGPSLLESPPFNPSDLTVSELKDRLEDDDYDWNQRCYLGLLEAEERGKNRTTAIDAITEKIQ